MTLTPAQLRQESRRPGPSGSGSPKGQRDDVSRRPSQHSHHGTSRHYIDHIQTNVDRASHLDGRPISMTLDQFGEQILNGIKVTTLQYRPRRSRGSGNLDSRP